jgi:ribosomal protein L21E
MGSNKKPIRERGKIRFSRYFQELEKGEAVAVVREPAVQPRFLKRLQGRTGVVEGKRGKSYVVKINDYTKEKRYLMEPIHLKKIKQSNKNDNQ